MRGRSPPQGPRVSLSRVSPAILWARDTGHGGWPARCIQTSRVGQRHTFNTAWARARTRELTFCQGVRRIEIPPPLHLVWKREGSGVRREQAGNWGVVGGCRKGAGIPLKSPGTNL